MEDLRRRLLVVPKAWDDRKRRRLADWIASGRVILAPWLKTSRDETVIQVIPCPPDARAPWNEDLLRAIFPSLSEKGAPNADSYILTSDVDRALLNLLERAE